MQIRPLHFMQHIDRLPQEFYHPGGQPLYGCRRYVSYDGTFIFCKIDNYWTIRISSLTWQRYAVLHTAFEQSGLGDVDFPRRIDAVTALEAFIDGVDT